MNLFTFYENHIWKWNPSERASEAFIRLSAEEKANIEVQYQEYMNAIESHHLTLHLLDDEWVFLGTKAKDYGLSRSQLIEQFIKDFAGMRRNGSDEEDAAAAWYYRNRCIY